MKGLRHIYGGQGGGTGSGASGPKLEGGKDEAGFHKTYGDISGRGGPTTSPKLEGGGSQLPGFRKTYGKTGPIETLEVGADKPGGLALPVEESGLGQDPRFYQKYGGPASPIHTLDIGSMSPRSKGVRYPHNAKQAANALRFRGGY
jgi:hypothetical protein